MVMKSEACEKDLTTKAVNLLNKQSDTVKDSNNSCHLTFEHVWKKVLVYGRFELTM